MKNNTGVIEGFYGKHWSWKEREKYADFLREYGFSFYIYAPKADRFIRKDWKAPFPPELEVSLKVLSSVFRRRGVEFGLGFSPYEIYLSPFDEATKKALQDRIDVFNRIGVDRLCVLMDDMKGGLEGLAARQCEILNWIAPRSEAREIIFCPTYYSFDPVLEKIFGPMPKNYFRELDECLDAKTHCFWTGEKVCSESYTEEHLRTVAAMLGRKPVLWDNYPVNDGARMCKFLHVRPFAGRPSSIGKWISGHAANPMNQPALSKIVLATLSDSYTEGLKYDPMASFRKAAAEITCPAVAELLERDMSLFADKGLDNIGQAEKLALKSDYSSFLSSEKKDAASAASEIIGWLDGSYGISREEVLTQ